MKLWLDTSKAYAIALEGGGAKGAYEVGVWRALDEADVRFDAVAGTSVGALNGAMMVMGELEQALRLWENIRFSQVFDADDEQLKKLFGIDIIDDGSSIEDIDILGADVSDEDKDTLYKDTMKFFENLYGETTDSAEYSDAVVDDSAADGAGEDSYSEDTIEDAAE